MSGRSRVRRVEVSPVRHPEPDVNRVVGVLVGLALEVEHRAANGMEESKERVVAAKPARRGGGSVGRAA